MKRAGLSLSLLAVLAFGASAASASWAPRKMARVNVRRFESHVAVRARTTLLVTPDGREIGGAFQRWIDADPMPSYRGTMVLDVSSADSRAYCDWAPGSVAVVDGCTFLGPASNLAGGSLASTPETIIDPLGNNPDGGLAGTLFYEQAHVVDNAYLTDGARARLMRLFGYPRPAAESVQDAWWAGEAQFASNAASVPPGEMFAQIYKVCAYRRYGEVSLDIDGKVSGEAVCATIARELSY